MAHEIGTFDRVAVTKASHIGGFDTRDGWDWHGLAKRMPGGSMTRDEAIKAAGLDTWRLLATEAVSGVIEFDGEPAPVRVVSDKHRLLVRSDTREVFTCVSDGYSIVQPPELFDVAEAIKLAGSDLQVESVGSVRNGRTLFASIRGGSFEVMPGDISHHYMTVILGMDGTAAWHHVPMAWRTLCNNGIRATLAEGRRKASTISIRHSGSMQDKINQARAIIAGWKATAQNFETTSRALAARAITPAEADRYFAQVIEDLELGRKIPDATKARTDKSARRDRDRCLEALQYMRSTLAREAQQLNAQPSAWLLANAATRFWDHGREYRGADNRARKEAKIGAITWGAQADAKVCAFKLAAELVGVPA